MKKSLLLLTLCMGLCCVSCYDDSALVERIDALEKNVIASINEQISAIKVSITSLEAVDAELKSTIKALEAKDATLQGDIDELKEADASLETKIGELKTYVDDEISNTEDWATATFATLEQYDSLCVVLTGIETSISELKEEFTKNLSDAISNSEESMKGWVNEQLTGYWTIAETQARLDTLKQTHNEDVEKLYTDLADAKEEMTEAYTTAISTAIEELDGKLSDKITKINDELTKRVNDIEDRLSAIEDTLKNLTRDFSIAFDDYDIGILAGGTTSVGYIITGATEKTTVKALGQNGWNAKVTPNGTDKGKITVTAPDPLTEDEIIVLVYDGEFRTIMSSINFVTGVVTPSQTAVELEAEAGTVDITVTSNLNYKVSIPEEAKDWLSVVQTKSTNTETITFAYTENEFTVRRADISFVDEADNKITKVSIIQQGSATEVTLSEAGKLLDALGVDLYKSIKSLKINGPINGLDIITINRMSNLRFLNLEDASIVEGGEYESGFLAEDNTIGALMFGEKSHFEEIILPNSVTSISGSAFIWNTKIKKVSIGENTLNLGDYAFQGCTELSVVIFNNKLQRIGENAFSHCSSIESLSLPHSLIEFGHYTFGSCSSLKEISIPESVTIIKDQAFNYCRSLKSITLPPSIQAIEEYAFSHCDNLTEIHIKSLPSTLTSISSQMSDNLANVSIYIPEGTYDDYYATPLGNFKQLIEE